MMKTNVGDVWLTSNETKKELKVSSCKLMHLREARKIKFKKVGNAYFYLVKRGDSR